MAQLYQLSHGKSKKKMRVIMIDEKHKCENYAKARQNVEGWHKLEVAPEGSVTWRQKSASVGDKRTGGYISKHGFQHHT